MCVYTQNNATHLKGQININTAHSVQHANQPTHDCIKFLCYL